MAREESKSRRVAEVLGVCCFTIALLFIICLVTYDSRDPTVFFKTGSVGPTRNYVGPTGAFLAELLMPQLFGWAAYLIPLALGVLGWTLFWCKPVEAPYTKGFGMLVLLLGLSAFLALAFGKAVPEGGRPPVGATSEVRPGGAVGELLALLLVAEFGHAGALIVVCAALFVALILTMQFSFAAALRALGAYLSSHFRNLHTRWAHWRESRRKERMRRDVIRKHAQREKQPETTARARATPPPVSPDAQDDVLASLDLPLQGPVIARPSQRALPFEGEQEQAAAPAATQRRPARPAAARGGLQLPPTTILDAPKPESGMDRSRLFEKAKILQSKCHEFGVMGSVVEIHPGPVVTTYEFKPDPGIKFSKVVGLADDLALALEAESIRIDRMSGRSTVAIEIPNEVRETISLRGILESDPFRKAAGRLTLALGKTVNGETAVTDLGAMPHLLIAGATGTGKSVGLNCMIASVLFKATPDEVRLILIDPKRLELGVYEDIPHLLTPVVTDPKLASNVLKWVVGEMERRIRMLASEGVRNIEQFNNIIKAERGGSSGEGEALAPLHYIIVIIDELADLMMVSSHEVEESITRLAQMARAVGIHLILATQRPSVDVLTGLIKANFPSRISFRVAARVDSRTILDSIGAEHLLGKGDMLFLPPGSARLLRIHGAYVTEHEIARLTSTLRKMAKPTYDDNVGKTEQRSPGEEVDDKDELFDDAVRFVVQNGQASTSMLQRRFRIGFSRAGRLVDAMEREGIVGPADGSKAREILVAADYCQALEQ